MWLDSDGVRSWQVILFPLPFHSQTTEKRWKFCHDGKPLLWEFTEFANSFSAKEFVTTSLGLIWALHQKLKSQYSICSFWPFWCLYLWPWINKDMEKQNEPNSNFVSICNVSLKPLYEPFSSFPWKHSHGWNTAWLYVTSQQMFIDILNSY